MAQDPFAPKDDGRIGLPSVSPGMNRIAPSTLRPDPSQKGAGMVQPGRKRKKRRTSPDMLGGAPAWSASVNNLDALASWDPTPELSDTPRRVEREDENQAGSLTDEQQDAILRRARKRHERCVFIGSENRKDALDDLKFLAGDQWAAAVQAQRLADKRPCLTINKLPTFVHQICNDLRQNRPGINVNPVGEKSDIEVAKMYRGLIRSIERESRADIAYDTAIFNAVANGFGYLVLRTKYERPDDFDQTATIDRIRNPFTVYLDPDAQQPDGSDAMYGFITDMMPRDEFKEKYPDADQMPYNQAGIGDMPRNWNDEDNIRIAEYYEVQTETGVLVALSNGHTGWKDELSDQAREMIASGELKIERERDADRRKVVYYRITATEVIEHRDTPWSWIPIIQFIGDEIDIEGKVSLSGVVRAAKDPQRMVNYWNTLYTELVALAPKAPFIGAEGQFEGHEDKWRRANNDAFSYLEYRPTDLNGKPVPPPQRQPFAGVPAGVAQAVAMAEQNMMATTGIRFDATMGERMMDESGRAIRELRRSGDLGSFHFADNASRSLRHIGEILVDAIPRIYDTKRMLVILREDDSEEQVQINPNAEQPMQEVANDNGKKLKIFNPTIGRYGVTVTIGPSYATKRIEASESLMEFMRILPPQQQAAVVDLVSKNMDWPGAEEITARLAKMLPPNLLTPDEKDVPPQVAALIQGMQGQMQEAMQQIQMLTAALNDKTADRAVLQEKVEKDYEAKVLDIMRKADSERDNGASQLRDLVDAVQKMMTMMEPKQPPAAEPEAA